MHLVLGTSTGARGAIGRCRGCATILPLRWPSEDETAEDWVCATCGQPYRGIRIQNLPREFAKNACLAGSTVDKPIASDTDLAVSAFLNPARVYEGLPHPITIAFPDRPRIACDLENSFSRDLVGQIHQADAIELPSQRSPFAAKVRDRSHEPYDADWVRNSIEQVARSAYEVERQFGIVTDGRRAELDAFRGIAQEQLRRIVEDKDLFAYMGIRPQAGGYPSRHALQVSMLAMSMGVAMGWDMEALTDLGMGCLIHDAGMLAIDRSQYGKKGILSAHNLGDIAKHVVLGLATFAGRAGEVSVRTLVVAYQIHERSNGSGYPRGYAGDKIHPLARVAAVADVFVALVSPRPHRPGLVPYHAIKKIMDDTQRGVFDKEAFRALLDTVSVFPVGSFVAISDGRVGRVLRPNPGRYDRPVVEVWRQGNLGEKPALLDMAAETDVAIANSLASLGS